MNTNQVSAKTIDLTTSDWLLGLAVPPLILGIIAARAIAKSVAELGQWSEEIFRGDNLPTLSGSIAASGNNQANANSSEDVD